MATRTELRGFLKQSQGQPIDGIPVRSKRSSHGQKECVNKSLEHSDDELVKHMSKLPGYLQRMDRGEESVQSNALNVGVLDWGRLEKWKHSQARSETKVSTVASTSTLETLPNDSHKCKIDDHLHTCSNLDKGKASRDLQHCVHGVRCTLEPELASRGSLNKQEIATSGRDHEGLNLGKSRRQRSNRESASGLLSEMGNSGGSLIMKETKKSESGKHCVDKLDGKEKLIGDSEAVLIPEKQEFSDIFILRSKKQFQSTLSGDPQMSLDDNRKVAKEVNCSLDFSDGINSSLGLRSHIPRSCPLSFDLGRDSEDMVLPLGGRRHSKTASRICDQEMSEDETRKNRQPSPSKRFSFSFGRLSKSFTFREDSSAQPLSSYDDAIKSDSMRFADSVCPSQSSNLEKHCGSRVSPLRRLLDPLLKPKGSGNALPSKERSCCSNPKPTSIEDKKKQDTPRTRALFQLTIRSGIPLFQFVVDDNNINNRSILGATMKTSCSSLKDDSVQYCTFYSVNEVKKKKSGSWLIHGHKEKQRGFVYNVIGQMQLSNSTSLDMAEQKSENISPVVVESVLFDESEQVKGRNEVAAVVIQKKPVQETSVIIPGGIHSTPEKGAPSLLISRWKSGGVCDCGGWDVGCKLHVLSNKTLLNEVDQSFELFNQEESEQESGPAWEMTELKPGIFRVEFGSLLSHLQAFFVCVTVLTCGSVEEPVSKTTVKSSSPFAPPLSPVGRV